jgi:site-specific recombinase XerD
MNRNLKIITGILNLPIDLDTRIARRFFAKEVNLKNGVPIETVSKLLGHSKISTTKDNYADVDQEKIIDDTAKVQELFKQKKEKFMEALR